MTSHACPRCGLESRRSHGRWWDRHPVAAALFALPAGYTLIAVMLVYPWFTIPVTIIAAAVWVDRRNRQRLAIAARADWEHRALLAASLKRPSPRELPNGPRARRRGADHWSTTQPIAQRSTR